MSPKPSAKVSYSVHNRRCSVAKKKYSENEIQAFKASICRATKDKGLEGITRSQLRKDKKVRECRKKFLGTFIDELVDKGKLVNMSGRFLATSLVPVHARMTDWIEVLLFKEDSKRKGQNFKKLRKKYRRRMEDDYLKQILLFLTKSKLILQERSPTFIHRRFKKEK
ncbi:hypothetical protein AVEN_243298-1 [Araneus ventricosus]|uniref:Uncharacterized protein n=1 Tax=Araneus ventricosus TaxID=182803 RepID=A0A4Y2N8Y6_ARAVE|nr:hypothetical protein AVEN_243298-1 [Araneus ventricosus]